MKRKVTEVDIKGEASSPRGMGWTSTGTRAASPTPTPTPPTTRESSSSAPGGGGQGQEDSVLDERGIPLTAPKIVSMEGERAMQPQEEEQPAGRAGFWNPTNALRNG